MLRKGRLLWAFLSCNSAYDRISQNDKWFIEIYKNGCEAKSKKEANVFWMFWQILSLQLKSLLYFVWGIQLHRLLKNVKLEHYVEIKTGRVNESASDLQYIWESIKNEFSTIKQAERMRIKLSIRPSIPRTTIRQQNHNNLTVENPMNTIGEQSQYLHLID